MKTSLILACGIASVCVLASVSTSEKPAPPVISLPALSQNLDAPSGNTLSGQESFLKTAAGVQDLLDRLPLQFVANRGQLDEQVNYSVRFPGGNIYFTADEIVYQFFRVGGDETTLKAEPGAGAEVPTAAARADDPMRRDEWATDDQMVRPEILRIRFVGARGNIEPEAHQESGAKFNYFRGNDPENWVANAPAFEKIVYRNLYPNVDLIVSGRDGRLKNEYRVKPGGDPRRISLQYEGARGLVLNDRGQLVVKTDSGALIEDRPECYQEIDGRKVPVRSKYEIQGANTAAIEVDPYDPKAELIIDPLVYSTFLGGGGQDSCEGIAQDAAGNVYIVGTTRSAGFPTTGGAVDTVWNGNEDVFVTKLNAQGTGLVYSTYLGGSGKATTPMAL